MEEDAKLLDRAVIAVTGPDAEAFLNRLVTNSIVPDRARFAALLTPQGKIITDFFVVPRPDGDGFLLDCPTQQAAALIKRLGLQKLRAKIVIENAASLGVAAVWGEAPAPVEDAITFTDPRADGMGLRLIAPRETLAASSMGDAHAYGAHRIAHGVPEGGIDFVYGDTFVQDANLDHCNGVDFKKGCYVGQEVVARVHYRKSARKRVVRVRFAGPGPAHGTPVMAGETQLGTIGSTAAENGLATLRLDKLEEARAASIAVTAGGVALEVDVPTAFLEGAALAKVAS